MLPGAARIVVIAACAGLLVAGSAPVGAATGQENVPRFGHVFMIIGENTTYSHLDSTNAPYLFGTIKPAAAWLTDYYAATHWSEANYVALTSGQFTGCEQKDGGAACHQNVDNLFHQIDLSGQTWKTWLEGGTAKCDTGSGSTCPPPGPCPLTGFYTTGNPAILYDDVEGPNGVWSATSKSRECLQDDVSAGNPMDIFDRALAAGSVADFNLMLPSRLCERRHCDQFDLASVSLNSGRRPASTRTPAHSARMIPAPPRLLTASALTILDLCKASMRRQEAARACCGWLTRGTQG